MSKPIKTKKAKEHFSLNNRHDFVTIGDKKKLYAEFLPGGVLRGIFKEINQQKLIINLIPGENVNGIGGSFHSINFHIKQQNQIQLIPAIGFSNHINNTEKTEFSYYTDYAEWRGSNQLLKFEIKFIPTLPTDNAKHEPNIDYFWHEITVTNISGKRIKVRPILGLDIGLTSYSSALVNPLYVSQYIDHKNFHHQKLKNIIASRQNLSIDGLNPWLAQGCLEGIEKFCTDGNQFFTRKQHDENIFIKEINPNLNLEIWQKEFSHIALQAKEVTLAEGESKTWNFFALLMENHPEPSSYEDAIDVVEKISNYNTQIKSIPSQNSLSPFNAPESIFNNLKILYGDQLSSAKIRKLYPEARNIETHKGETLSLFAGKKENLNENFYRHVATRQKEILLTKPHGFLLRSGTWSLPSDDLLSTTVYMDGVFNYLTCLGNSTHNRLLSRISEMNNLISGKGQRIFVRANWLQFTEKTETKQTEKKRWLLLGVPSLFEMGVSSAKWVYHFGNETIVVENKMSLNSASCELTISATKACKFLLTNNLAFDASQEETGDWHIEINRKKFSCKLSPKSNFTFGKKYPKAYFYISAKNTKSWQSVNLDEVLFQDKKRRNLPYICFKSNKVNKAKIEITGKLGKFNKKNYRPQIPITSPKNQNSHHKWLANYFPFQIKEINNRTEKSNSLAETNEIIPWFAQNSLIHLSSVFGLEQSTGGAWGARDVTQGSLELLLATNRYKEARYIILSAFANQNYHAGSWAQWSMLAPYENVRDSHMHFDVPFWQLKAVCDYIEETQDLKILKEKLTWFDEKKQRHTSPNKDSTLLEHIKKCITWIKNNFIKGTALISYGTGDWNDSLQPANQELKKHTVSSWTVALSYHVFRKLEILFSKAKIDFPEIAKIKQKIYQDFYKYLVKDNTVCGFFIFAENSLQGEAILHPSDSRTGISFRLLPMMRAILAEIFSIDLAEKHLQIIKENLVAPDGARLMDKLPNYDGGKMHIFQRAETASFFGREIGLLYTHAHLRYIQMLAKLGRGNELLTALRQANPILLNEVVKNARFRQANAYFSSSDACFKNRYEAKERYEDLRSGKVEVEGGWRIYSSGPGIYLNLLRSYIFGFRQEYDEIIFDPVLPDVWRDFSFTFNWQEFALQIYFLTTTKDKKRFVPKKISINGNDLEVQKFKPAENPYRQSGESGLVIPVKKFISYLTNDENKTNKIKIWN